MRRSGTTPAHSKEPTNTMRPHERIIFQARLETHKQEVDRIAVQVQQFYNFKQRFRVYHGSSNSTRPPAKATTNLIDTRHLDRILRIDRNNKIAVVESNVPMDALLEQTLKHGLMPLVVTEFPGITMGGAFSGTAGESSSFKHGFFNETVCEIEMILGNGEVVTCSDEENRDIFKGAPGALGTLGVVTILTVRLQTAPKYGQVTYHPFGTIKDALEKLHSLATQDKDSIEYLDDIMFSPTKGAIITGRFAESVPNGVKVQRLIRAKDPWFFMHVESCIDSNPSNAYTEFIPLPDYVFRYNRGTFWCGKTIFDLVGIKFKKYTRRLFDRLLTARMSYKRLHMQEVTTVLIQDVANPFPAAEIFIKWSEDRLDVWPLWLCPIRVSPMPTLHPHPLTPCNVVGMTPDLMLNVGIYDVSGRGYEEWITQNRDLEDKVTELGGMKWAYAAQMYPEDRFWQQHDPQWYDTLRERCRATYLPSSYDKTRVDVNAGRKAVANRLAKRNKGWRKPLGGVVDFVSYANCVWKSVRSQAWRLERRSAWKHWPE